jgi:hypothetical protein
MAERSSRPLSRNASSGTPAPAHHSHPGDSSSRLGSSREAALRERPPLVTVPVAPADEVAQMALMLRAEAEAKSAAVRCDACDGEIEGEPAGSGLYLWTRGDDDVRFEEPPLCEGCATAIGTTALRRWDEEDEEEG